MQIFTPLFALLVTLLTVGRAYSSILIILVLKHLVLELTSCKMVESESGHLKRIKHGRESYLWWRGGGAEGNGTDGMAQPVTSMNPVGDTQN